MNARPMVGIIPAAGSGTRLGYLSSILPKTLFPLYDRPILHYVIDQMRALGIGDIYIIVNIYRDIIIQYCRSIRLPESVRLRFVDQPQLMGTGNAILAVEKHIGRRTFAVIYGDDCTISGSLPKMIDEFCENGSVVTEAVIPEHRVDILRQTCSVKLTKEGKIMEILEKPQHPPYRSRGCGVYVFNHEVFEYIRRTPPHPVRGEKEITYTINMLAKEGKAFGCRISGHNININTYEELLRASILYRDLLSGRIQL